MTATICILVSKYYRKAISFPNGSVVKDLLANAGDAGGTG